MPTKPSEFERLRDAAWYDWVTPAQIKKYEAAFREAPDDAAVMVWDAAFKAGHTAAVPRCAEVAVVKYKDAWDEVADECDENPSAAFEQAVGLVSTLIIERIRAVKED